MRWHNITAEGAKALAKNTTLTSLNLSWSKIGNEGAMALADNTSLTSLNLKFNDDIGDKGVSAFEDAVGNNPHLASLDLLQGGPLPNRIEAILLYNRNRTILRRTNTQELLRLSRIVLLAAPNNSQDTISSLATLPQEIKYKILAATPAGTLLSKHQRRKVFEFAQNRETLKHSNNLSFLKIADCRDSKFLSCTPSPLPPRKRQKQETISDKSPTEPLKISVTPK